MFFRVGNAFANISNKNNQEVHFYVIKEKRSREIALPCCQKILVDKEVILF